MQRCIKSDEQITSRPRNGARWNALWKRELVGMTS